ncbi:MAG: IPTL-CTERM sorting domain-containing protein [Xanthomonadales bacterium]|nr:IPTL-CTERM sorting domain-containing protein [Gammaproteobacteria bacterium]NNK04250.1 IPTL-CTERM sorting domain-containing protein [Xanthomonadales bacterium]
MSKKTITALALALTMFAGAAQAAITDVAVNGDFETGDFTGWTLFPGSLGPAGQTIVAGNPGSAARLLETAPAANIIKQANLLPGEWTEGQLIEIQFDISGTAGAGGVLFAELFSELSGGGTSKAEILGGGPLFPDANPEVWTTYNFSGTVGPDSSGGITLQFNSACAPVEGCIADYRIDNVIITADIEGPVGPPISPRTSAIPTTSQWALIMLTMLLGLVVFTNRKRLF